MVEKKCALKEVVRVDLAVTKENTTESELCLLAAATLLSYIRIEVALSSAGTNQFVKNFKNG